MDDFKDIIKWELFLPKNEGLSFQFSVSQNENREETREIDADFGNVLLSILQDTFYITNLASFRDENILEDLKRELNERDSNWNVFRWIWRKFTILLRNNYNELKKRTNSEESIALSKKKGNGYRQFVDSMGEPFAARYKLYSYSLTFWSRNFIRKNFGSCTDIICSFQKFTLFWTGVLNFLSESVRDIQKDDVENLKLKFEKILNNHEKKAEYDDFKEKYLQQVGGCFSLTMVERKDKSRQDVLCFSGLYDFSENSNIGKAIKKIEEDGGFQNPKVVKVSNNIKYDLICGLDITYGEAQNCSVFSANRKKYNRMFSCCERKTIADYAWNDCASYKMVVKYAPCELCKEPVRKHNELYKGSVLHGKSTKPLKSIGEFDKLAKCMCSNFCPLRIHFPHLCNACSYIHKP